MILLLLLAALPLAGLLYQHFGSVRDARLYPPPGRLVVVGTHRLHIHEQYLKKRSHLEPTVILEAGIAASSVSWQLVQRQIAEFADVVSYDRAGLGWSDPSPEPATLQNAVAELRALIDKAGLRKPFILVGHSFGGLAALEFAQRYPLEMAGLVLVDTLTAGEWHPAPAGELARLSRGVKLARRGAWLAKVGFVRLSLDLLQAGSRVIPKLAVSLSSSAAGSGLAERMVGQIKKMPEDQWPIVRAHWCQPKSFQSMADHLENLPASASGCSRDYSLGNLPLTVLTASDASEIRKREHVRIAASSTRGQLVNAEGSGHWIQLDRPELVVSAVQRMLWEATWKSTNRSS